MKGDQGMGVFYHDEVMRQAHRQDLLNEAHVDRLVREARGGRRSRTAEFASNLVSRLGCLLLRWGKGIYEQSQQRRGARLMNWGARLNAMMPSVESKPCDCCA